MHRLLERQIKRHFGKETDIPEELAAFIAAIDNAYHQADADRKLLERSLDLTSEELFERNTQINTLYTAEQTKNHIIEQQSKALLDVVQSVAAGDLDARVEIPEGVEVISELAVGIEFMIDDIKNMLAEQDRAREIIETALNETETLYIGSDRVLRSQSIGELLSALLRSTALQKFSYAAIYLFDTPINPSETPTGFTIAANWEQTGLAIAEPLGLRRNFEQYPAKAYVNRSKAVVIHDVEHDHRVDAETRAILVADQNIHNIGFWPLEVGGQWLGFIVGQSGQVFNLDESEMRQIESLTDQAAIVINGINLYEQAQAALAEAEATHQLYLQKQWEEYTHFQKIETYFTPKVFTSTSPEQKAAAQTEKQVTPLQLDIPITIRGQAIGNLQLEIPSGADELSPEQQALVNTVTHQMGLALENLRLINDSQRRASREELIRQISAQIRSTLDMQSVLRTAATEIRNSLGLAAINIQLGYPPEEPQ